MDNEKDRRRGNGRYWYHITIEECVLCGRHYEYRERRPAPKPDDGAKRYEFRQFACNWHFM